MGETATRSEVQAGHPPIPLIGLGADALAAELVRLGVPERQLGMRLRQLKRWVYVRGATSFAEMTDISKDLRERLVGRFSLARPQIVSEQISRDGTRKWLLRLAPGGSCNGAPGPEIETVYIPEEDRGTLCISSQVGCTLNCTFCHTGTQPLVRNLSVGEIVGQIVLARDRLGDWPGRARGEGGGEAAGGQGLRGSVRESTPDGVRGGARGPTVPGRPAGERAITNIVLMGMGEPLLNFENVRDAMALACDPDALGYSRRRVTLSTSGIVPMIGRWGAEAGTMLAISLHAVDDDLRDVLVPINRRYPIAMLLEACRNYPGLSNAKRITFEYVMLKGVNDSPAEARALVRLLAGIPAKINLIPFNPWPGAPYECSDWETIERFGEIINRAGYASPIRRPRGRDIMAACGQLKSASRKLRARERGRGHGDERAGERGLGRDQKRGRKPGCEPKANRA